MSELIKTHKVDISGIEPVTIEGFRNDADGKLLALPIFTDSMVTYYNKDLSDDLCPKRAAACSAQREGTSESGTRDEV
jgi:maltose-binding protein MalE